MIGMRRIFALVVSTMLLAFTLPALGHNSSDDKFNLKVVATTPGTFNATIKNLNNEYNERVKSFKIKAPPGVTITGVTSVAGSPTGTTSGSTTNTQTATDVLVKYVDIRYNQSVTVTLTAVLTPPVTGCAPQSKVWDASAWEGSTGSGDAYRLSSTASDLTTTFTPNCNTITASAGANGSISPSGSVNVTNGANQAFTITPNANYHVADVLVDGVSAGAVLSYTFSNVTGPHTIAASFAINTFTINAPPVSNGSVSPTGITTVNAGDSKSYTIAADTGYYVTDVLVDGATVGAVASYTFSNVTANRSITATFAPKTLKITSAPTSALVGPTIANVATPGPVFSVIVALVPPPALGTAVTLTATVPPDAPAGTTCPALSGGSSTTNAGGSATFSSLTFTGASGNCLLTASAPSGSGYPDAKTPLLVLASGNLACGDPYNPTAGVNQINGSAASGLTINDPGFAEGGRGANVKQTGTNCPPVNWTFTNNVLGAAVTVDAKGNTVPPNGVSFVWDQTAQPNAAYTYTVTWQPEWFGLASTSNRKTSFCTNATCTTTALAQACLGPALDPLSLPSGAQACVSAEVWAVVPMAKCTGAVPPLPAKAGDQNTCVIFSTTIIDIEDPPIIRG